jgi:hypothetical protein
MTLFSLTEKAYVSMWWKKTAKLCKHPSSGYFFDNYLYFKKTRRENRWVKLSLEIRKLLNKNSNQKKTQFVYYKNSIIII